MSATMTSRLACLLLAAIAFGPIAARAAEAPKIARIEARLIYETTGTVSGNIAPPADFSTWNSVVGEGDSKEPANDLLVQVHLAVPKTQETSPLPLRVTVTDAKGRKLAARTFASLLFDRGRLVKTVHVPNASCLGRIKIKAAIGKAAKDTAIWMNCGE